MPLRVHGSMSVGAADMFGGTLAFSYCFKACYHGSLGWALKVRIQETCSGHIRSPGFRAWTFILDHASQHWNHTATR